ncbi:protein kinase [Burkholderia sp. Ax-1724]|uniref:serine/threonine protein kinase n=1 Tax=Burkholderia sp. Ax-1724 TaxID=2608336 RepID=UPI0014202F92|nr:protein kinase [Burkholderia sp. Ax-1724]NIF56266.1 protein kinase [Burkholderia sp. Ax-1724]
MEKWSKQKKWEEEWISLEGIGDGGQGATRKVRNRATNAIACMKTLNKPKNSERRARLFREATAYATCDHACIPSLVQSNAQMHEDQSVQLFLVTEFIEGKTLWEFIEETGPRSLEEAASTTIRLLDVAEYFHSEQWVHRDIKPDNIILRNGDLSDPVLIDFGLAYRDGVTKKFQTEDGQGLDNRFLRLPELSVNSVQKQDPRTDLAFFGGILFYMLTGVIPGALIHGDGRLPHQRAEVLDRLREVGGKATYRLLGFFDHTFAQKISLRFTSAIEMREALEAVLIEKNREIVDSTDNDLQAIKARLNDQANEQLTRNKQLYDIAMEEVEAIHRSVLDEIGSDRLKPYQTGYVNFAEKFQKTLGFSHFSSLDKRFTLHFEMTVEGEELVITVDDVAFYRADVETPTFDDRFRAALRERYIAGLRKLIDEN